MSIRKKLHKLHPRQLIYFEPPQMKTTQRNNMSRDVKPKHVTATVSTFLQSTHEL